MELKKRSILLVVSGILVIGLVLSAALPLRAGAAQWFGPIQSRSASPVRAVAASVSGSYFGKVELDYVLAGTFSDPLPAPDPGLEPLPVLGSIDLGMQLTQGGTGIEGYIDLEHTQVFTTEHTIGGIAFGPMITGSFDGTHLTLESERVSVISGGQKLMRQVRLTGGISPDKPKQLVGEYRETVWGYGSTPVTAVGRFTLDWDAPAVTNRIFMPLIKFE